MADILIIENPSSRRGRRKAVKVREFLERSPPSRSVEWVSVAALNGAAPPDDRLVAVGGDGTVNAAASWLLQKGHSCPLAIIPAGTGNNLARGLGVPLDLKDACRLALTGDRRVSQDVVRYLGKGEKSPRLLIQSGSIGFPAEIAALYDRLRTWRLFRWLAVPMGTHVYSILALLGLFRQRWREFRAYPSLSARFQLDGEVFEENALAIFVGNEKSTGGNFVPCPLARTDDGKVDICVVRIGRGVSYAKLFTKVSQGKHLEIADSVVYRQTEGPVEIQLSRKSPFAVDGDLWMHTDAYTLEVLPGQLKVVVG